MATIETHGRNCAVVLEALGGLRTPYGWTASVRIDDGVYVGSWNLGKLAFLHPKSTVVFGSMCYANDRYGEIPSGITTPSEMRDALIVRGMDLADMMTLPRPVPACFDSEWK
jgi:hypothetical protein